MKLIILSLLLTLISTTIKAQAAVTSVQVLWDANTETDLVGYKVYWGVSPKTYTNSVTIGKVTTVTLTNLVVGVVYYIAATAYNSAGLESDFSNEAVWKKPLPPKNTRFGYLVPQYIPLYASQRRTRWIQ
jgi:chitinase